MANEWEIKGRSTVCTATGRAFADGEFFYTLLFTERGGFRREDLCEEAWQARDPARQPFSFWRSKFEVPPPPEPEPLGKQNAETLLRRTMAEPGEEHANLRYFLALMLERKRLLKPVEVKEEDGKRLHLYLHAKTGELFVIPDPRLRLDQLESVQAEIAELLG
ncbi:MAG: hypothetical protein PHQ12_04065 [Chthoniobacteraceae bacterium]|nr:hypothetical protein [Chthoniobacteraceae bacterium]